ncbi:MAG TPA: pitrilysin family protein [Planctomycetota bacterium]|nr:pitrilysin family protein [Planctomycetota bacterium]
MQPAVDFTLENGLRVIVAEDHASPVAAFGMCVRAGVCDEPSDRRGIAHFFEHMMFRGSERFGPKEHTARITRVGGDCNAGTSIDPTIYYETFPAGALDEILALEADRFMRLKLTAEHVEVERKVVLEELRMYENQPMSRAFRQLMREIGRGHPYGLDPLGRTEDLAATTVADLEAFRRRQYRPGNAFAVIAGDVRRADVEELMRRHFGEWRDPPEAAGARAAVPRFEVPAGRMRLKLSFEVPAVARVHRLKPSAEEDHAALDLLTALLADGESSPVQERLVKRRRLCVHAGGECLKLFHGGALVFYGAFLPPGRHGARLAELREICDRFAADGPPREEFAKRIKRFRMRLARANYSVMERMMGLGNSELVEGGYRKYEQALEDLAAVTPARIRDLAARLFAPENTLELEVVPEKSRWWMPLAGLFMRVVRR